MSDCQLKEPPFFLPANVGEFDLPLTQTLALTAWLLADLADGQITASASTSTVETSGTAAGAGAGAAFVDFVLAVEADISQVPEPSTLGLLGAGLLGLGLIRIRRTA